MTFLKLFRKHVFWHIDRFRKYKTRDHYIAVKKIIERTDGTFADAEKEKYLQDVLAHAVQTTPFYEQYSEYRSILDFPVINKNMIRGDFDAFRSSVFLNDKCTVVSTSGSTGAPFSVLQNPNKRHRSKADNLYFAERSGYELGQRLWYIKIWSDPIMRRKPLKLRLQNICPQSVFELDDQHIKEVITAIEKEKAPQSMLGYTSAFETICKYLDKTVHPPIKANVTSIITMSEGLNAYVRSKMHAYFGVSPVSRYSNNENGIIAQEDPGVPHKFVINEASYYIEIFDLHTDIPVGIGKRGRIIVTDLHNYAMPLIRYDTGDIGVLGVDEHGVPYLQAVEGRVLDLLYDTKGNLIPSHLSYRLCKYGEYKQFQLVQYGAKEYLIKLNTDTKVDEEKMIAEYKGYFGDDAIVTIEYVSEIPLLSSGKRREVLNTYHTALHRKIS